MNRYIYDLLETPAGWAGLLGSGQGLRRLTLKSTPQEALEELGPVCGATSEPSAFPKVRRCLGRYFRGEVKALDEIDLDLEGAPPFFGAAWAACRCIPPGETRSYAWLAAAAGRPLASRAAGQAMARNPVVLVIPCHRVIASSGDLGGYGAGGLEVKAWLLELEQMAQTRGAAGYARTRATSPWCSPAPS